MSTIKDEIKDSGRLEEIMNIILEMSTEKVDRPVRLSYSPEGDVVERVNPDDVRTGIKLWTKYVDTDGINIPKEDANKMFAFATLVESELEMRLHNYANSCSHRKTPSEDALERIRTYSVLHSSLNHLTYPCYDIDTSEFMPFQIPNGWKVQKDSISNIMKG